MPHAEPYSPGEIDIATAQAMATLLWVAGDMTDAEGNCVGPTWDAKYTVDDFTPKQVAAMRAKLEAFMTANLEALVKSGHVAGRENNIGRLEQIGHDYVLTTGGHGAGFWDRGLGEWGDILTEACRADRHEWSLFEASEHIAGEPGKIYCDELERD